MLPMVSGVSNRPANDGYRSALSTGIERPACLCYRIAPRRTDSWNERAFLLGSFLSPLWWLLSRPRPSTEGRHPGAIMRTVQICRSRAAGARNRSGRRAPAGVDVAPIARGVSRVALKKILRADA